MILSDDLTLCSKFAIADTKHTYRTIKFDLFTSLAQNSKCFR